MKKKLNGYKLSIFLQIVITIPSYNVNPMRTSTAIYSAITNFTILPFGDTQYLLYLFEILELSYYTPF